MSDNEDLLADDLGDHSLADYNLGNEEEEQLLADDYENASQNVPASIASYAEPEIMPPEYPVLEIPYNPPPVQYQMPPEPECVVPNITVEVPNTAIPEHSTYAPYEPRYEVEHAVPPAIPAAPMESPQIVPSDMPVSLPNESRERFPSERPVGARAPVARDIPDSLDKVIVPGGGFPGRGRTWRHPQYRARLHHYNQYRRNNMHRGNFQPRPQYPPPPRQPLPPSPRGPRPQLPPDDRPLPPERPMLPPEPYDIRPPFPNQPRFFRPNMDERPNFPMRPPFEPRPMFFRPPFNPRPFPPGPLREVAPNSNQIPQVTIRHGPPVPNMGPKQQEVRMLPVQLPASLPPGGLAGKKVLINPHFKGNYQPVDGLPLPAYIPTRIQKSPPLSPTLENKFGPIKDIDDAAERFIAEQRSALARAAGRKPQRYIENTTIEIENELAQARVDPPPPRTNSDDDELLRRQEEFINANRAGLRRRMRSPSPPPARRSPSPRRSPERRLRVDTRPANDEDSEYRRRMREQESLRERVLRAKEARRRKNAVASQKQMHDRERERLDKEKEKEREKEKDRPALLDTKLPPARIEPATSEHVKPDTTRKTPENERESEKEIVREKTPVKEENTVNSTCEPLTPPRLELPKESPERALTPPLPVEIKTETKLDSDDDLDLILGDIDGILSDDEDTGRFKDKSSKSEPPKSKPPVDLRTKLPPKTTDSKKEKPTRQKIIFHEEKREERKRKDKTPPPPKRTIVTSSTKTDDADATEKKLSKTKEKSDVASAKSRSRITFDHKKEQPEKDTPKPKDEPKTAFANRRVILQRKVTAKEKSVFTRIEVKNDPAKPNPGIFSRAVRTAIGADSNRIVIKKQDDPAVEYESDSDIDESKLLEEDVGLMAMVENLPHGMTDTRLKTLAGAEVQSLVLDKEERNAKITFKTTIAAESFKRKFNNKMVAASRLSVTLR